QPDEVLHEYMRTADVVINLRNPHFGEASWSLLEAAFMDKPTVVWKHGYYDEYPDDTVAKIENTAALATTLERLCCEPRWRETLGERVGSYARETFTTERYAEGVIEVIRAAQYNKPVLELADFASDVLAEV